MPDLAFTAMTKTDIDEVLVIEEASFQQPWGRVSFEGEITCRDARGLILRHNSIGCRHPILAYLCSRVVADELHILKIAVADAWRGRGCGRRLLQHGLEQAEKEAVRTCYLEVRQTNADALRFYRKAGFYKEAQLSNYYSDTHEDVILMRKNMFKEER